MAATTYPIPTWEELDEATRAELDEQYLREWPMIAEPGATEEALQAYLAYRHERPAEEITTFEEGTLRRMLHPMVDPSRLPDPAARQEHIGWLERFGARRFHWTNERTYVAVLALLVLGLLALLLVVIIA